MIESKDTERYELIILHSQLNIAFVWPVVVGTEHSYQRRVAR